MLELKLLWVRSCSSLNLIYFAFRLPLLCPFSLEVHLLDPSFPMKIIGCETSKTYLKLSDLVRIVTHLSLSFDFKKKSCHPKGPRPFYFKIKILYTKNIFDGRLLPPLTVANLLSFYKRFKKLKKKGCIISL